MSGMKRMLDEARDEGLDAFHDGYAREACPHAVDSILREYWLEGFDYAQDQEIIGRKPMSDEEVGEMLDYHFGQFA